ncbi:MAG: M28 family metallopeptidase [Promethearchaeota archaeon]
MIEKSRIKENLESFSIPRLSGSETEESSFNLLKEKIRKLNLKHFTQNFSFSSFYSRIYPKISLSILFAILFILILRIHSLHTILFISIFCTLLILILIFTRNPERIKLGKIFHSQNVYVKLKSTNSINENEENLIINNISPNIFLFSHLDSKGQRFTIKFRVISVWLWTISIIAGFSVVIIHSIIFQDSNLIFRIIEIIISSINFIFTLIIILNTTNNNSNGAIDNASGVSCVLELLHFFSLQENRLKNYNLWFVFTGAEESGTMGIRNFYKYIKELYRNKNYAINFDSICNKIYLYNHGLISDLNPKTLNLISNKEDIIELKNSKIFYPGIRSDGLFLLRKKFSGLGIGDESIYKYIHSNEDSVDKINITVLEDLCNLITVLLSEIDNI